MLHKFLIHWAPEIPLVAVYFEREQHRALEIIGNEQIIASVKERSPRPLNGARFYSRFQGMVAWESREPSMYIAMHISQ